MLQTVRTLALPRKPIQPIHEHTDLAKRSAPLPPGMSPKKAHEVEQLSYLISNVISNTALRTSSIRHVVDAGAGQGHLARALSSPPHSLHVLALDSNTIQTDSAQRWDKRAQKDKSKKEAKKKAVPESASENVQIEDGRASQGSIRHSTVRITPETLPAIIDSWFRDGFSAPRPNEFGESEPIAPVLLVGLHACGSLTPSVLRSFISLNNRSPEPSAEGSLWKPAGLVIVGCCYNLMDSCDFPLSDHFKTQCPSLPALGHNHLQLAAQCPALWLSSPPERARFKLARRKAVFRALLGRTLERLVPSVSDAGRVVGRLNDAAYESWETFLTVVGTRLGVDLLNGQQFDFPSASVAAPAAATAGAVDTRSKDANLSYKLEILHVLRCLVGSLVEDLIVVDRYMYLLEECSALPFAAEDDERGMTGAGEWEVNVVNVFDQLTGSARNIALVVSPADFKGGEK
ncbi:hypothetical protein BOTBODRAFT_163142 [Botryobasidium botryosum FD-172 SS1]|uniref:Methyltransferase domain-containing protein n=1 Tax=Botryobasidium botryosum (strain FD-172 SS1) TaxID=930990 RepID=A0A067M8S3_BOTB1|nr:hypothetical protein BOTBODRAFT_163142 [Botryobasidium botryosum FD-172 SS1]